MLTSHFQDFQARQLLAHWKLELCPASREREGGGGRRGGREGEGGREGGRGREGGEGGRREGKREGGRGREERNKVEGCWEE